MREAILTLTELPDEPHESHELRYSDSSFYDLKCIYCGAHDEVPGGWGKLRLPCYGDRAIGRDRDIKSQNG